MALDIPADALILGADTVEPTDQAFGRRPVGESGSQLVLLPVGAMLANAGNGKLAVALSGTTRTLTTGEAQNGWFVVSGTGGTLVFPSVNRVWWLVNNSSGDVTVQRAGHSDAVLGAGTTIIQGYGA